MPAMSNAPLENSGVGSLEFIGGQSAADNRSARPIAMAAPPVNSGLPTKLTKVPSVLVVEDDAMIGLLLGEMLEGMGYDVCGIEATEADAVNTAARCKPDLMIVDVQLGDGSGVSAVNTIHRDRSCSARVRQRRHRKTAGARAKFDCHSEAVSRSRTRAGHSTRPQPGCHFLSSQAAQWWPLRGCSLWFGRHWCVACTKDRQT